MEKLTQIREAIRMEEDAQRSTHIFKVARAKRQPPYRGRQGSC